MRILINYVTHCLSPNVIYSKRSASAPSVWLAPCSIYDSVGSDNVATYFDTSSPRCIRVQQADEPTPNQHRYEICSVSDDTWYQIIVRSTSGSNIEAWVNGTKMTIYTALGGSPPGTLDYANMSIFNVGSWFATLGVAFDGKIAEVGIWDRALTGDVSSGEIQSLIDDTTNKISDVASSNLIRYWPLYDSYEDYSGNGEDLVAIDGTPSSSTDHPVDPPTSIQPAMAYYMNMMRG